MRSHVELFLTAREAEGCTQATLRWHKACLSRFVAWIDEFHHDLDPNALTATHVRSYIVWLQHSNLNATSVATYVRSLRAFLAFLFLEEIIEKNIALRIKEPKTPKTIKTPLSPDEMKALIDACETNRDSAIVALLIDTGIRANELCTLTLSNVLLEQRLIMVMGKGQKMRAVPFSVRTSLVLRKHLLKHDKDSEYVFLGRSGNPLTPNGLLQLVMRLGKRANVEDCHPHRFRHTFAISFLRAGGSPLQLQKILGHETLAMTSHYTALDTNDIQDAHNAASPLMKLLSRKQ
jgi:integrase/recombinase XerD